MPKKKLQPIHNGHKALTAALCLLLPLAPPLMGSMTDPPMVQSNPEQVYLLHANTLEFDKERSADYQLLKGDVQFRKDSMFMYCDSAYFYENDNSLDAFGNVRMEQGDTLFVYGDVLFYNGNDEFARLRNNVRMINREVVLTTDSLNYDQKQNIGYYFDGGRIVDTENNLTSLYGQYSPDTKDARFNIDVVLVNEQYTLYSDTLEYNTESKIATILGPSTIVSDSNIIYSSRGWYNTIANTSMLLDRSELESKGQTLIGDTIYYNRNSGVGEVFGNMELNDTTRKVLLYGQYGFYNELTDYAFATDSAFVIEHSSPDSLFMHGDTLEIFTDTTNYRVMRAYYDVRFFRNNSQGVCDSLVYLTKDSLLNLYTNPILWSGTQQIYGDTIKVFMNDSTIQRVEVPQFAFVAQQKDSLYFDQLTGKNLIAYFEEGEMRQVDVSGNVQTVFFPQERDGSYTGLNNAESSFLTMYLRERQMEKLIMKPAVQGTLTPIALVKRNQLYLPTFKWYDYMRPTSPDDIFRTVQVGASHMSDNSKFKAK